MKQIRGVHVAFVAGIIVVGCAIGAGAVYLASPSHDTAAASTDTSTSTVAAPTTAESADDRMNEFLDQHNNPADQHERMRKLGRGVCSLLGTTGNYGEQVDYLEMQATMNPDAAKMFLNASIDIYCPVYQDLVPTH